MNLMNKALPFLNKLIPSALAIKGLSKIDNRLGSFIQNSLASGYTTDNVLEFLRTSIQSPGDRREMQNLQAMSQSGNIHPEQQRSLQNRESQEKIGKGITGLAGLAGGLSGMGQNSELVQQEKSIQAPSNGMNPPSIPNLNNSPEQNVQKQKSPVDFIAGYFPELAEYINKKINEDGLTPEAAAGIVKNSGQFGKQVKLIEKDTKEDFIDLIARLFGGFNQNNSKITNQQSIKPPQSNADSALLSALDKILKM